MQALINKITNFSELNNQSNIRIGSGLLSLKDIVENEIQFNIPIYQRLYVWKIDQIKILLEDLKNAFLNNNEEFYFLGSVMFSNTIDSKIDLVDGQQRFTTLWLICDILSDIDEELKNFTYNNNEPRILFSIRDRAQAYLKDKNTFKEFLTEKGELIAGAELEVSEIIPLALGREIIEETINNFQKDEKFDKLKFSKFIFSNVQLTYTIIPKESDLNRVFEAMNNRGKQLENHEILKSRLLEKIEKAERNQYAMIWDACSQMNSYIENNLKNVNNFSWKDIFGKKVDLENESESDIDLVNLDIITLLANKTKSDDFPSKSLLDILNDTSIENDSKRNEISEIEYYSKSVRSIISFPTFLLHTLRVFQIIKHNQDYNSSEINDKKLLDVFNVKESFSDTKDVKNFIKLLWKLRVLFDKYVIKWIYNEDEKEEYHFLEKIQISKSIIKNKDGTENENISVQRIETTEKELLDLIKLQGMLYHSQEMTTQYWLTPFLFFLQSNDNLNSNKIVEKLEKLENALFYSETNTSKLKDRTFKINFLNEANFLDNLVNTREYLSGFHGTGYPNYIFYKLEYILWKYRESICRSYSLDLKKWNRFRLTAKNSIEHIFPQKTKDENEHIIYIKENEISEISLKNKNPLDDFGNLVLLSPGMNSEYSNKPFQEKKGKFDAKQEIDSLKSSIIFKNTSWNWSLAKQHRDDMINLIEKYINELRD